MAANHYTEGDTVLGLVGVECNNGSKDVEQNKAERNQCCGKLE